MRVDGFVNTLYLITNISGAEHSLALALTELTRANKMFQQASSVSADNTNSNWLELSSITCVYLCVTHCLKKKITMNFEY